MTHAPPRPATPARQDRDAAARGARARRRRHHAVRHRGLTDARRRAPLGSVLAVTMTQVTVLGGGQLGLDARPGRDAARRALPLPRSAPSADGRVGRAGRHRRARRPRRGRRRGGRRTGRSPTSGKACPRARRATSRRVAPVLPPARALEVAQDRLAEKEACTDLGDPDRRVPPGRLRAPISTARSPSSASRRCSRPAAAATTARARRCCATPADVDAAWAQLGGVPLILEAFVPFDRELSIVGVRGASGETRVLARRRERAPRRHPARHPRTGPPARRRAAGRGRSLHRAAARRARLRRRRLRRAVRRRRARCSRTRSRPACTTAGTGRSKARRRASSRTTCARCSAGRSDRPRARGASAMVNCIGTMPERDAVLAVPGAHLHDYGKEPRPGRKLGHVTVTAPDPAECEAARSRASLALVAASTGLGDRADVAQLGDLVGRRSPSRRAPRRCAGPATARSAAPRRRCARSAARAPAAARRRAR